MRIATYNVRVDTDYDRDWQWQYRSKFVKTLTQYHNWDLFGLQEVRPNQITDFEKIEEYSFISAERNGDGNGEGLAIGYQQEKLTLIESGHFWLSLTPQQSSIHPDAAFPRICLWGIFKECDTKKDILIVNMHLDHVSEVARFEGMKVILQELGEKMMFYPTVLLGDLNAEPEERVHELLLTQFKNSKECSKIGHYGPKGSFQNFEYDRSWKTLEEIDYIYVKDLETVKTACLTDSCDRRFPSDHFPLEAELQFREI